ncbi:MAG: hypothetical protein JWN73_884 [Betaproteobacteria bacterium]|nr:hypothetical protein [Betaproteobacteria bacterium]
MRADKKFAAQLPVFWANVRTISQEVGYTQRGEKIIKVPTIGEIRENFARLGLTTAHIVDAKGLPTEFGVNLLAYFTFRARILNDYVQNCFMDKAQAEKEFTRLKNKLKPKCPLPMNKQTGEKKNYAFLTGLVNMLVEANIGGAPCNYDPRSLTTITHNLMPYRTMARRVDGAFPAVVNPIAIWEIKEYYYTTTFGSRVADGVYETLLDGMELEELEKEAGRKVQHVLFIDDRFTWWECGRSYLCRIIDMLHMGYVDEVVFGREVLTRLPLLAKEWKIEYDRLVKLNSK